MKKIDKYLLVVAGVMALGGTLDASQVVNLDFQPGGDGSTYSVNYEGQGAASDTGAVWNIVAPAVGAGSGDESGGWYGGYFVQSNLLDSAGSDSGMSVSFTDGVILAISTNHGGYADIATDATGLMSDYLQMDSSGFSRSVFVEGLATNQLYELYLYGSGPWNRDTFFAVRVDDDTAMDWGGAQWVGSATTDPGTVADPHALTEGADYVKFTFTTASTNDTLWIEYRGDGDGDDLAPFNGLQLVALQPLPEFELVPEYQTVTVGSNLTLVVTATNAAVEDVITLSAVDLPAGATFETVVGTNGASRTLSWNPATAGVYTVTFAADGTNGTASASTKIYVEDVKTAPPVVVNVDFQPGGATGGVYSVNYSGPGALSDAGTAWNIVAPTADGITSNSHSGGWFSSPGISAQALTNSDGTASGMTLSTAEGVALALSTNHSAYADIATNAAGLMGDYLEMDSDGFARSVFIEGLTPGRTYELYLYGSGPWARDTHFAVRCDSDMNKNWGSEQWIGETTTDTISGEHSLIQGADYVRFVFTPAADMDTLWIDYNGDGDGDNYAPFNGLQLATIGSPEFVPVPADQTVAMGSNLTLAVTATNAIIADDVITLSATNLPGGATFESAVGTNGVSSTLSWNAATAGVYTVTFAAEGTNGTSYSSIDIVVNPDAPANLSATAMATNQIDLAWDAVAGADSYTVYRSTTNGGEYAAIASVTNSTTYSDTTLAETTTYYYVVSAVADGLTSADSNQASATTLAAGPTESPTIISSVAADGSLVISWADGFSYNVLTNADLTNPNGWGVATNGTSPITNAIGGEAALFYKLQSE